MRLSLLDFGNPYFQTRVLETMKKKRWRQSWIPSCWKHSWQDAAVIPICNNQVWLWWFLADCNSNWEGNVNLAISLPITPVCRFVIALRLPTIEIHSNQWTAVSQERCRWTPERDVLFFQKLVPCAGAHWMYQQEWQHKNRLNKTSCPWHKTSCP